MIFIILLLFVNSQQLHEKNGNTNLCNMKKYQNICTGNMNLTRNGMPQLTQNKQEQFLATKQSYRISVNPLFLFPTQSEINATKVSKIIEAKNKSNYNICTDPNMGILVVYDNTTNKMHIIDGHHRYAACYLMNESVYVDVVHETAINILNELNRFDGVNYQTIDHQYFPQKINL